MAATAARIALASRASRRDAARGASTSAPAPRRRTALASRASKRPPRVPLAAGSSRDERGPQTRPPRPGEEARGYDDAYDDDPYARDDDRYRGPDSRGYDDRYDDRYDDDPSFRWADSFSDAAFDPSSSDLGSRYARPAPGAPPPDVTPLTTREKQALIPIGATGEQYGYFWGGAETATQRVGFSLLGLVAFVNASALLAVPAATFFLWAPVALAARRNARARRGRCVGLWRARVLSARAVESAPTPGFTDRRRRGSADDPYADADASYAYESDPRGWALSLVVGDASGARVELRTPLRRSHAEIAEGDEVEMVVGSDDVRFLGFEAVGEAYFPATGAWAGEYPFLDRRAMPAVSDRVARDARRTSRREGRGYARGDGSAGRWDEDPRGGLEGEDEDEGFYG